MTNLPLVNATLNSIATILIIGGLAAIKLGNKRCHAAIMAAALITSAAFLTCYLIYHATHGHQTSDHMGAVRPYYLVLLLTHVIAAIVNLPMIIGTVLAAVRKKFDQHRAWAKWTYPVWLYVSITGVAVYLTMYVWFPAAPTP